MKLIFKILLLVIFTTIYGCIKSDKSDNLTIVNDQETERQFVMKIEFKTNKPDVFNVSMHNIEVDRFQKKSIEFFEDVEPSTGYDSLRAEFDPENLSKYIIIGFGKETEKEIDLKSISITYGDNVINLSNSRDFNEHLELNKFIVRDSINNIFKTKRINGQLNPIVRIKPKAIKMLETEVVN